MPRLTKEDIGSKIAFGGYTPPIYGILCAYNEHEACIQRDNSPTEYFQIIKISEIQEPKKKPSERITEIFRETPSSKDDWCVNKFKAVIQYLDEQANEGDK